eukprot:scaffold42_cov133-Cylindrotheca_fusiformis.AAC.6
MPHHSSHRQAGTSAGLPVGHPMYSPHGIATEPMRGHTVAHIMRPNTQGPYTTPAYHHHNPGMVTPLKTNSWTSARSMPTLETPRSADSADPSSAAAKHDDSTVETQVTEGSTGDREKREATASALLLVSAKCRAEKDSTSVSTASTSSKVPLKKRKEYLTPTTEAASTADACHLSPVSHSSQRSIVGGRTISKEESSPERGPVETVRSASYDSKESPCGNMASAQALLDSSKINNAKDITPLSRAPCPHFPSVLHQVLSDEADAKSILQWMEDGESWKVLRWDALRREILPRHFSGLTDENGKGSGTIDAFLWHLTAWGFEESEDGSYRHSRLTFIPPSLQLFIRGAQKLCRKMKPTRIPSVVEQYNDPNTVSPHHNNRSILEVPSLSTPRPGHGTAAPSQSNKRARYAIGEWSTRPQDGLETHGWGNFYTEAQQVGMRHAVGQYTNTAYDPRYQMGCQPYSPPQVTRSGRGRLGISRTSSGQASPSPSAPLSSFPVSNRGKGNRKNMVCKSTIPTSSSTDRSSPVAEFAMPDNAAGSVQSGVAIAVSRKTKRKLPLSQKTVLN